MVDGRAAAQTLLSYRNIKPGLCLHYVWLAYKAHGARATGTWPTAYSAWKDSPGKHEGDRNPPAGVPVWFGPRVGSAAGDVVISLGGGRVACTDWPRNGVVGSCTIDERQRQIGRPYLGWTETILGARIDFDSGALSGSQRRASAVVNGRAEPSSRSALAGEPLQAGAVGNFVGWIRGESVDGNNVWFKGTSGRWFWSGGFQGGGNVAGLTDLNAPAPAPAGGGAAAAQRKVGANGANGRADASTAGGIRQMLTPGTVGDFNGWKRGQNVEGNDVWFRGAHSGDWFWSGGFEGGANTAGLADLNPPAPAPVIGNQRTARFDMNGRGGTSTAFPVLASLAAGAVGEFDGWARGESVTLGDVTSDVWLHGAHSGAWFALAGLTPNTVDGLAEIVTPTTPPKPAEPVSPDNPRGLQTYTPVYPGAFIGLVAPLGDGRRGVKGLPPNEVVVPVIIDRAIEHHTGSNGVRQVDWFSHENSRSSCPTWYIERDGRVWEFIRPGMKPALTGPEWNWRSVGWELLDSVDGTGTPEQFEAVCQILAWLASHNGRELDGVPVDFELTREFFINHREALPGTECPGDWWASRMDAQLERAREIYAYKYAPKPDPEPDHDDDGVIEVERSWLQGVLDKLKSLLGAGS